MGRRVPPARAVMAQLLAALVQVGRQWEARRAARRAGAMHSEGTPGTAHSEGLAQAVGMAHSEGIARAARARRAVALQSAETPPSAATRTEGRAARPAVARRARAAVTNNAVSSRSSAALPTRSALHKRRIRET